MKIESCRKFFDRLKKLMTQRDLKIEEDWLRVEIINEKYSTSEEYAWASNLTSRVLLRTTLDEYLMQMVQALEIINCIQKLRTSLGTSIDYYIKYNNVFLQTHSSRIKN